MSPTRCEHRLIILRRSAGGSLSVLLLRDASGFTLPCIESGERRAADTADLNRAVRETLGLEVSVLRTLRDEPAHGAAPRRQLSTLEAHGAGLDGPAGGRWIAAGELSSIVPEDSHTWRALDIWRQNAPTPAPPATDRDWTVPGWRDDALVWVARELARRGLPPVRAIEQLRLWEFSHVLRLHTDGGPLYFKARPPWGAVEPRLTLRLARRHPRHIPDLVAVEVERGWMLMRATPGPELMDVPDPVQWEAAAAAIARIQIDWLDDTAALAALGCPTMTLAALGRAVAPLLGDDATVQPGGPDSLSDAEAAALRARRGELEALCRALDDEAIPASLEHGDLWAANVIAGGDGPVLIDWESASVAHPFFSPALLLESLDHTSALASVPDSKRRLRDAYLGAWHEHGPRALRSAARLERAFELAQRAAMLFYADQFRRESLPLIETSWEIKTFAPYFLRRLLAG